MLAVDLTEGIDFRRPPAGVEYHDYAGKLVVKATHRSILGAIGTLAVSLFWNGILSVFVFFAIVATLSHLGIHMPHWFPAPKMNGAPMSVGMTIFLWLFLTPFIAIGFSMIVAFLMNIGGKTEVQIDRNDGVVFTGIGPLGFRKRFQVASVSDVRLAEGQCRDSEGNPRRGNLITIESRDGKEIKFGSMLSAARKKFVTALLHKALVR
jgi:hypothetical protein